MTSTGFGRLSNLIVVGIVLASTATAAGNGFRRLTNLVVVLAGAAILTSTGLSRLCNLVVVLANAAIETGLCFRGLLVFMVVGIVLAGATVMATGNVILFIRPVLANWAFSTGCCVIKWVYIGFCHEHAGGTTS